MIYPNRRFIPCKERECTWRSLYDDLGGFHNFDFASKPSSLTELSFITFALSKMHLTLFMNSGLKYSVHPSVYLQSTWLLPKFGDIFLILEFLNLIL